MPDVVAVLASIAVGVAFLVAGGSKLAAGASWTHQSRELGAPAWVAPVLPWVELAVGAGLVVQISRRPLAVAAAALLVGFTTLIVANLAAGRRPPCACFGAWSATPIGPWHVARNLVLIALALVAIA